MIIMKLQIERTWKKYKTTVRRLIRIRKKRRIKTVSINELKITNELYIVDVSTNNLNTSIYKLTLHSEDIGEHGNCL